ncbi:MAG: lipopolysaccharide biosynthesis protein RfbH, partial [Clostridium sp.]|nr:lipopolysaccharide biosynthesis protein RfbH [Clostridium sp.]
RINYSGRYFDEEELINLVDSSLDFWLTSGRYGDEFEKRLCEFLGVSYCLTTTSGSSANLLAFMSLTSSKLGNRSIKKGDEVITVAAGFPTTIAPIIQYGAVPVFLDIDIPSYNIKVSDLEKALSSKTKCVMVAHTLGNPFDIQIIKDFCDKNNLWLIEDNCDALGSKYLYNGKLRYTGTVGDISTSSFYPPHHITTGEGGAVYTNNKLLSRIIASFRDWGRDCYCKSGVDNTCKHRFSRKFGDMPIGYDHKYIYSHWGYNLKMTEMQGAIGCAQVKKIDKFRTRRIENWNRLKEGLSDLKDYFILPEPYKESIPSWFGFMLTIKNDSIDRVSLLKYLEEKNIQTRLLFAGNITRQPLFEGLIENTDYRIIGSLKNTDVITEKSLWLGVYPGLTDEMIDYMIKSIKEYVRLYC